MSRCRGRWTHGALSALLDLPEDDVTDGLSGLSADGSAAFREGFGWLLREVTAGSAPGHSRERRDELRSRGAHQLAVARAASADCVVLCEQLEDELRRAERRRRGRDLTISRRARRRGC